MIISPGVTGLGGLITVSGENSRWDNATGFFMSMGTLDVLDRGVVSSGYIEYRYSHPRQDGDDDRLRHRIGTHHDGSPRCRDRLSG